MSNQRTTEGGWVNPLHLPKGPNGRALCRRCGAEVTGRRRTFCSAECVHQHRIRTDAAYLRECCWRRDKGICAACGVDAMASKSNRPTPWLRTGHLWQADHIVPVAEGGGECDLDNIRTLCTQCHKQATKQLAARLAAARKRA